MGPDADGRSMRERMLAGDLSLADDPELAAASRRAQTLDSVVGAGAVVPRDLPAGVVAVGNPARVVRDVPR